VSFLGLILHNLWARKVRTALTAVAVAVGVATVVTLGVVTHSLRSSAVAILKTGKADFTIAQKNASDVLNSVINQDQVTRLSKVTGIERIVGVMLATTTLDADHPLFIQIGIDPADLRPFGVNVVAGRPFGATAAHEMMLGWRASQDLGKRVGDSMVVDGVDYRIVGVFSVGQSFGDAGGMFPLIPLQAHERQPDLVSLAFVQVKPGTDIPALRRKIQHDFPVLTTIKTASEFGRADRTLVYLNAADRGATFLALVIGAVIVTNTMLLSFFERTREFGLLRAIGWARLRILLMVIGEALIISVIGAGVGVGIAFGVVLLLEQLPSLVGVLSADFTAGQFGRALWVAAGIGFLGAIYPALRAAFLQPIKALRRE